MFINVHQITASNILSEATFITLLMVLTPSRYLHQLQKKSFGKLITHDDVRHNDRTVHYIFCDDVRCHDSSKPVKQLCSPSMYKHNL